MPKMKKTPCFSRPSAPRAESPGMLRRISKTSSLLPVLVLLMIMAFVPTVSALACSKDSQCRRDVCIFSNCAARAGSGGTCQANTHCFYSATQSCINSKCLDKSPTGEVCDDFTDCLISGSVCPSGKCLGPLGSSCSLNSECASPLACIKSLCSIKSPTGGDCDETDDCSKSGDVCTGGKCETPFVPSLMVWDGNQGPLNPSYTTAGVVVNGILFVFEGLSGGVLMTVEAYDDATKTWTSKTGPGISSYAHSVVAVGTSIFLIGGAGSSGTPLNTFYSFDTEDGTWDTTWDQLPEGRSFLAAAAVDNTVFVFGGISGFNSKHNSIRSLDVSAKGRGWNMLNSATLPVATSHLSATTAKNEIFITGGIISGGFALNTALKYNTNNPGVSPISINSLNQPRIGHMSFYDPTHDLLYVVGGIVDPNFFQFAVEVLDLSISSAGSWSSANALNSANLIYSTSGGLIGSRFHFASDLTLQVLDVSVPASVKWSPFSNSPSPSSTVIQMTGPNTITAVDTLSQVTSFYNTVSNTWTVGSSNFPSFALISTSASTQINGELYVMGGDSGRSSSSAVFLLNAAGDTWFQKDNMPTGRAGGCAALDGTDIYLYGGASSRDSLPVSSLFLMDTTMAVGSGQWSMIAPAGSTPIAVSFCAAVVVDRKLLIFGGGTGINGATPTGMIQSFDITTKTWDLPLTATITARSYLSAVFLKGFVFVMGGSVDGGATSLAKAEVFEVSTQKVSAIKDMPTPRSSLSLVTDGTSVFAVGGETKINAVFPSLERLHTP